MPLTPLAAPVANFRLRRQDFGDILSGVEMDAHGDMRAPEMKQLEIYCSRGCASKKKAMQAPVFSAGERYAQGMGLLEQHKLGKAVRTLSEINNYTTENRVELEPKVRLALADATYYQGTDLALIDSRALYLDFVTLYGDLRVTQSEELEHGPHQKAGGGISQQRSPEGRSHDRPGDHDLWPRRGIQTQSGAARDQGGQQPEAKVELAQPSSASVADRPAVTRAGHAPRPSRPGRPAHECPGARQRRRTGNPEAAHAPPSRAIRRG